LLSGYLQGGGEQLSVVNCQLSVEKTTDNKLHRTTDD
jgi:hypothetical protein